jgi:hypothetical protein
MSGRLRIRCLNNPRYETAAWIRPVSGEPTQFTHVDYVAFDSCRQGWRVGDIAYPRAVVSEISIGGGSTHNTPVALRAQGNFTYLSARDPQWNVSSNGWFSAVGSTAIPIVAAGRASVIVPKNLPISEGMEIEFRNSTPGQRRAYQLARVVSYSVETGELGYEGLGGFGVGSTLTKWTLRPALAAIISEGAFVDVNGGEVGMPAEIGRLVSLRANTRSDGIAAWGQIALSGLTAENPGILADTINLTGKTPADVYPGGVRFSGARGFVSQDEPLVVTSKDFNGRVVLDQLSLWSRIKRKSPTAVCGSEMTQIFISPGGVSAGGNFPSASGGIQGCTNIEGPVGTRQGNGITATKHIGGCTLKIENGLITETVNC